MTGNQQDVEAGVKEVIVKHFPGKPIARLEQKTTGVMHLNYEIEFADGRKVFYRGQSSGGPASRQADIYFGGPISLERELAIIELLRRTDVPVPEVHCFEDGPLGKYVLMSFLEGVNLRQYLEDTGHNLTVFFDSLRKIGRTLASTRRVLFSEFGSIQPEGVRNGRKNWADRLSDILLRHETNPHVRRHFTDGEWSELKAYLDAKLGVIRTRSVEAQPQIVIYDLHARNFNVHAQGGQAGGLSGVFDVEFAQSAHPSLEWEGMSIQIFPLYGMKWFPKARAAFWAGYREGGGEVEEVPAFADTYLINHALSAVGIYDGVQDGIRDGWSEAFKQWSLDIARGQYDPAFIIELTRILHKVPRFD